MPFCSDTTLLSAFDYPVGRLAQAAACKAAKAGAIPARDSISPGISVERHTPVLQTGIEGALPSCPSTERSLKVRRLLREQEQAGALPAVLTISKRCEIPVSARTSQAWPRRFNSAFASQSLQTATRVANFDSEVPALNRRELGANPRRPTISMLP